MNRILAYLISILALSCQPETEQQAEPNQSSTSIDIAETADSIDTLLNTNDYLILGTKEAEVKIVKENEVDSFPVFEILAGYQGDVVMGRGIDYEDVKIYRKYKPKTSFEDYYVKLYEGTLADPDFSTNLSAKRFITRIKKGCEKGINFAGHYTLVIWGCGSPCQSGVIVDRKTGKIYDGYGTSLGAAFRKDSKMIIRNIRAIDTTTNLIKICAYCDVNHEIWTGTEFKEIE